MSKKKHLSVDSVIDDSVMNASSSQPTKERKPTGSPVGQHLAHAHKRAKDTIAELTEELESRPKVGIHGLDPNRVRRSKFANRNKLGFEDDAFKELTESVRFHEGNDIAAKVRPISDDPGYDYEVVYGHRRHEATRLAGTPFYATIHELSDRDLVQYMHLENQRLDLSAFEEGAQFIQWLDEGVYSSATELAAAIGESKAFVSQRTAIHSLPEVVFKALRDPRQLGITAWRELCSAYKNHPGEVSKAAADLSSGIEDYAPAEESDVRSAMQKLIKATKPQAAPKDEKSVFTLSGVPLFRAQKRPSGYVISLDSSGVGEDVQEEALRTLEAFLLDQLSGNKES